MLQANIPETVHSGSQGSDCLEGFKPTQLVQYCTVAYNSIPRFRPSNCKPLELHAFNLSATYGFASAPTESLTPETPTCQTLYLTPSFSRPSRRKWRERTEFPQQCFATGTSRSLDEPENMESRGPWPLRHDSRNTSALYSS
jgi:hypothetical protein